MRVLFVDDDPKEIKELRTMLGSVHQKWEMEFATSGEEALNFFIDNPPDVVVSDMHMPEMDGVKLLGTVMKHFPETVRILLSEPLDKETALRSVKSAHQFLMKPCSAETMKYTIERTCKLQDLLRDETLKEIVTGIKDLPSLPSLYNLIIKEIQSPKASLKKVGYIISQDVSMSARVLQLINSAIFGLPRIITSPQQATIFLGIDTLKALVLSIHVFSSFIEDAKLCGFSIIDMQKHSMMVSRLAGEIARTEIDDEKVVGEAIISGMLHNIGKLILLKVPVLYKEITELVKTTGCDVTKAEYTVMKTSHAELGAYLLGLWGIPNNVVEAVAFYQNPSKLLENIVPNKIPREASEKAKGFTALTAVHTANALMMQENSNFDITYSPYIDILYLRKLNLINKLPEWLDCYNKVIREGL
jgi:HD-like signal output (HDOD) protein